MVVSATIHLSHSVRSWKGQEMIIQIREIVTHLKRAGEKDAGVFDLSVATVLVHTWGEIHTSGYQLVIADVNTTEVVIVAVDAFPHVHNGLTTIDAGVITENVAKVVAEIHQRLLPS